MPANGSLPRNPASGSAAPGELAPAARPYLKWSICLGAFLFILAAVDAFCIPASRGKVLFADALLFVAGTTSCGWLALGAAGRSGDVSTQTAWRWICAGVGAWTFGQLMWLVVEVVFQQEPFPSIADCFYLLFYPFFFRGVLGLPFSTSRPGERKKLLIDVAVALLAALLLFGNLIIAPLLAQRGNSSSALMTTLALVYPSLDLGLLWPLCVLLLARRPAADQKPARILAASILTMMAADVLFSYQSLIRTYASGEVSDAIYCLALIIAGIAGACRAGSSGSATEVRAPEFAPDPSPSWQWSAIHAGVCILLLAIAWTGPVRSLVQLRFLVIGSLLFVALIVLRQIVSLREKRGILDALERTQRDLTDRSAALATANVQLQAELSERHRLEEERFQMLARMQEMQKLESLGVLAGGVAHDFNNILTVVIGNLGLARLSLEEGHPAIEALDEAERASERAADLTQQMLAYSGGGQFRVEAVDVNHLLREMGSLLTSSLPKGVEIHHELAADAAVIDADATQIRQVIMNLIINAGEAAKPDGGIIRLRTSRFRPDAAFFQSCVLPEDLAPGDYVCIEVEDDGCGMDAEVVARIFDPFYSTKFTGRGLGLSATLGIVRSHAGAIQVVSARDKGTKFCIALPASSRTPIAERGFAPAPSGSGTILIVDDESSVRTIAKQLLQKSGYNTVLATNGLEAVALAQAHPESFSAALLDLTMPVMGGVEAFERLRRLVPNLPIIITSGYNAGEVAKRFEEDRPDGFVQKPFTLEKLTAALGKALRVES